MFFVHSAPCAIVSRNSWVSSLCKRFAEDDAREFYAWLEGGGAICAKNTVIGQVDGQRGLIAANRFKEGDTIARIPPNLLVNSDELQNCPVAALWSHTDPRSSLITSQYRLALWMIVERREGTGSKFWPYINILPDKKDLLADGGPLDLWDETEKAWIE